MQPSSTNERAIEQGRKQNQQALSTQGNYGRYRGPLQLYPLSSSPHTGTNDAAHKQANQHVPLIRRTRLIAYPLVEQHVPPAAVPLPGTFLEDANTGSSTVSSASMIQPHGSFLPAREDEAISLLDTRLMVTLRPREAELRQPDMLVNTLIEDITKQVTLTLPVITTRTAEKKEKACDQHEDVTTTAGGAAIAGIGDLSYAALRYLTNVVMTHMVPPAVYGVFGEVYTATVILAWIAKLGLEGVLLLLLPSYRVKDERGLAAGLVRFATGITLISGLFIGTLFFALAAVIARLVYHDPSYRLPLQEVALLIPLMALQVVISCGLQAFKEITWKIYIDRLSQPLITLIALFSFYLLGWRMEALCISAVGGFFFSALIGQVVLSKVLKRFSRDAPPEYTPRVWIRFAVPMFFNGLLHGILNSTDILFLSLFVSSAQAGIYIAADRVSYFVVMPLFALVMIFAPMITEYHIGGKHEQLVSMFKMVTKWSLSLSLPVLLCIFIFRDAILAIFGPQYIAGGLVLTILCFGNFIDAGTGSVAQLLMMTGHRGIILLNGLITLIASTVLSLILVPSFNILGAAIASAIALIINNGLCLIEVYCIMKIHPYRRDICKPLIAGGAASLVGVLLLHFIHPGPGRFAIVEELSLIMPFFLVYVLATVLLRFSEEDRIVFRAVLAKFSKKSASSR